MAQVTVVVLAAVALVVALALSALARQILDARADD